MKIIYFILACISSALGAIGVLLPVLPATPFLLLAAVLFAKSSKRLHQWFVQTKLYQRHLESFVRNREMTLETKIGFIKLCKHHAFTSNLLYKLPPFTNFSPSFNAYQILLFYRSYQNDTLGRF